MRRNVIHAIGLAVVTAVALPAGADAQTPRGERGQMGPRAGAPVERLIAQREALGLTDQQVAELRRIEAELQQKNAPLLAQLEQARAERPQMTDEQRAQMRERRGAMRDSARMTPEQRAQMRERMQQMTPEEREAMRARMRAQMQDSARPRPMPEVPEELRATMEQVRANNAAALEQAQAVLTPEQREKVRALRPEQREGMRRAPGPNREHAPRRAPRGGR